jgi:hypothetical protein
MDPAMRSRKFLWAALAAFFIAPAQAQTSGTVTNHAVAIGKGSGHTGLRSAGPGVLGLPLVSSGSSADPVYQALGIAGGGTGQTTRQAGLNALMPPPVRTGDVVYWNGSNWVGLAGNNSGANQCLQESAAGVPSWGACGGGLLDNLLPNTEWKLWTSYPPGPKQTKDGTASQTASTCASFDTLNGAPTFHGCASTGQIKVGDIVVSNIQNFWNYAGAGAIGCSGSPYNVSCPYGPYNTAARVVTVTTNSTVGVQGNFSGVSGTTSTSSTLTPWGPLIPAGTTAGPDGWTKTGNLTISVDDWGAQALPASTAYPGCERPLLLRKGVTGQEYISYQVPTNLLPRWRGRTVSFGAAVYHRVQGGSGTGYLFIGDSAGSAQSNIAVGASVGHYEFEALTYTISQTTTGVTLYIMLTGNAGDVVDVCLPTAIFASNISQAQLGPPPREIIRANSHWNPPLLTPFIIDFPTTELATGSGLIGWNSIDLEAISLGIVHNVSTVYAKVEWQTHTVGAQIFFGGYVNGATGALTFGLQATTLVSNQVTSTSMARVPVYFDGTLALYGNTNGLVMAAAGNQGTLDFTDVDTSPNTGFQ